MTDVSVRDGRPAVAALFMASGMCGLVFEIIWVRQLTLTIGYSTFAVSLVVAAFLLGLVLGSLYFGPRADRMTNPLIAYAKLELFTGLSAAAISVILSELPDRLAGFGGLTSPLPLRALLAFVLILPPTFLMGGTLPILTRWAARDARSVGHSFAVLYSLNTFGAALGCGLAGFVLVGRLGLLRSALFAAGLNLFVAGIAWVLSRREQLLPPAPPEPASPPRGDPLNGTRRTILLGAFFAAGFSSIAYEVLWFRVLSHFMESSVYVFTLLLVTYLLGLVLGGLWYALRMAGKASLSTLAALQLLIALTALLSLALLGEGFLIRYLVGKAGLGGHLLNALHIGVVILVPTTLIGVAFPLVAELIASRVERVGQSVGLIYSVNTLGGILGSLVTGLLLIPALGTQRAFLVACGITLLVAMVVVRLDERRTRRASFSLYATTALIAVAMFLIPRDYLMRGVTSLSATRLLDFREGRDGTVSVFEFDKESTCRSPFYRCEPQWCPDDFRFRKVTYGSVSYAGTIPSGQRYMRVLAHLPMLTHPAPRDVLQVCFGTGSTAASFSRYPELESLTVVDLNPDVLALAPWFEETNLNVVSHPKATLVIDDGRRYVAAADRKFDVISFEPPPPTAQGAVNLYSQELYRRVREKLKPGGMLTQWIPLDQQSDLLGRALIKSLQAEFPYVSLWIPSKLEAVVLASDQPLPLDPERLRQRFAHPEVRRNLEEVGYDSPEELLGSFVMGPDRLEAYTRGIPPVTDDRPAIEYYAQRGEGFDAAALLAAADPVSVLLGHAALDAQQLGRAAAAHRALIRAHVHGVHKDREAARAEVATAAALTEEDPYTRYLRDLEYGCLLYLPGGRDSEPRKADAAPAQSRDATP